MMIPGRSWRLNLPQDSFTSTWQCPRKCTRIWCIPARSENTSPRRSGPSSRQNRFFRKHRSRSVPEECTDRSPGLMRAFSSSGLFPDPGFW